MTHKGGFANIKIIKAPTRKGRIMKILLISDIHSNSVALKTILDYEKDWDAIYCAGDYVDYGIDPKGVLDYIKKHNVIGVRGNHDDHLLNVWSRDEHKHVGPEHFKWIHHNVQLLSSSDIDFLRSMPKILSFDIDGIAYVMKHQWFEDSYETIQSKYHFEKFWDENYRGNLTGDYEKRMIFGHTHRQGIHILGKNMMWINPGSISYRRPDDCTKNAHYVTITNGLIELKEIPYEKKDIMNEVLKWEGKMKQSDIEDTKFFFGEES